MRQSASLLGVDITSQAVKLVEVNYANAHYQIKNYAIVSLPAGAVVGKTIVDKKPVVKAIKLGLQQMAGATRMAAVAIPNSAVMTKRIHLDDSLTEREIENHIFFEADVYFEVPLIQIYTDFIVLGKSQTHEKQIDILVIAAQRQEVEIRTQIIKAAGLKLMAVDVESLALTRAVKVFYEKDLLVAQVDQQSLLLGMLTDNNLSQLHAEQWQQDQSAEFIVQQIKRQLQIFSLQLQTQPEQILLMGDQANLSLANQLREQTQIPIKIVDCLIGELSSTLMLSYGLAMWLFT